MKTLKVLAVSIFTLGTVTAASAQVHVSVSASFGSPGYLPIYRPAPVVVERPVYYEEPVVYARPRTVIVERPVYYRRPVVYSRPRTVVVRDVVYRDHYRPAKFYKQNRYNKHNKHVKHVRYARY